MYKLFEFTVEDEVTLRVRDLTFRDRVLANDRKQVVANDFRLPAPYDQYPFQVGFSVYEDSEENDDYVEIFIDSWYHDMVEELYLVDVNGSTQCDSLSKFKHFSLRHGCHKLIPFSKSDFIHEDGSLLLQIGFQDPIFRDIRELPTLPDKIGLFALEVVVPRAALNYELEIGLDLDIIVDTKTIKASKFVLGSTSPVFSAMFSGDWQESRENILNIGDDGGLYFVDYETMKAFVDAIHGVKLELNNISLALKLKALCDMYEVRELGQQAENYVNFGLNDENVVEALVFSDKRGLNDVKTKAIEFITASKQVNAIRNFDEIPHHLSLAILKIKCAS